MSPPHRKYPSSFSSATKGNSPTDAISPLTIRERPGAPEKFDEFLSFFQNENCFADWRKHSPEMLVKMHRSTKRIIMLIRLISALDTLDKMPRSGFFPSVPTNMLVSPVCVFETFTWRQQSYRNDNSIIWSNWLCPLLLHNISRL